MSTGDSIGLALRARVTREREIVCVRVRRRERRKDEGAEGGGGEIERKSGGGRDEEKTMVPEG